MKRIALNNDSKESVLFRAFLLAGFLLGILLPNVLWKMEIQKGGFAGIYLIESFTRASLPWEEYLVFLARERLAEIFILILCGVSVFGIPAALLMLSWTGFFLGGVLTVSILQFGAAGGLIGLGFFFPQYLLYFPALLFLASSAYSLSSKCWKNQKVTGKDLKRYGGRCVLAIGGQLAGIFLECFLNPVVMQFLVDKLSIF